MNPQSTYWFAAYTLPRAEKKALHYLTEKNIETYLPLKRTLKQWSDRKKWVEEPLFNSYIFVKITPKEFMRVAETNHVLKVVTFQGRPAIVRDEQIESIRLLLENGIDFDLTNERFREGDSVEVFAGILQGLRGEVIQIRGAKKLLVRIEQIGSYLVTEIPANSVKLLENNTVMM